MEPKQKTPGVPSPIPFVGNRTNRIDVPAPASPSTSPPACSEQSGGNSLGSSSRRICQALSRRVAAGRDPEVKGVPRCWEPIPNKIPPTTGKKNILFVWGKGFVPQHLLLSSTLRNGFARYKDGTTWQRHCWLGRGGR